jgi:sigma-B regulation protein RsbU (phosphoserine phosphatase)
VQVVKTPLRGVGGKIIGLQGIFWDITAQRVAEQQIRAANTELARSREQLRVKNVQMEDDLKTAREIQQAMLPRDAATGQSVFQFTHRYFPAGTVGGDFFNITALSEIEAAVFICDVAGHGVRSALVTAMIRALVEELRPLANSPGDFLTKLNSDLFSILKHTGKPLLTTAFYLVANAQTGKVRYANAGHPKPLHIRRSTDVVEQLTNSAKKSQPALGLFERAPYHTSEATLAAGDLIMFFTDGLYEVHTPKDELYSQDMLAAAVRRRRQAPAAQLFDGLLAEIHEFAGNGEFDDDVCIVGLEFGEAKTPD